MGLRSAAWKEARAKLQSLLSFENTTLQDETLRSRYGILITLQFTITLALGTYPINE